MQFVRLMRAFLVAGWLCFVLLLGACASKPTQHEQQFGKPEKNQTSSQLPSYDKQVRLTQTWQVVLGKGPVRNYTDLSAAIADDVLYMADVEGGLYAIELASGAVLWQQTLEHSVSAGVSLYDDELVLVTDDGVLRVFDVETGKAGQQIALPSAAVAPVAIDDDAYYVRTVDGQINAYKRSDGGFLWNYSSALPVLTLRGTGKPVVYQNLLLSGLDNGKLIALDKKLGVLRWAYRLSSPDGRSELERLVDVDGTPLIQDKVVFAVGYQGQVAALTPLGRPLWEKKASSYHHLESALENLYLSLASGEIKAIDRFSGQTIWQQNALAKRSLTQPVVYKNYLLNADAEGYVHVLKLLDGKLVGRKNIRPRPLHITYPNRSDAARWRPIRNIDFGIRAPLVATDKGVLVYTNAGALILLNVEEID